MDTYSSRLVSIFFFLFVLSVLVQVYIDFWRSKIKREKIPYSIATRSTSYKPTTTLDETLPRTRLHAMNSPLSAEHFAIWPATPQNPSNLPTTSGPEHYMYSTAERIEQNTALLWDPALFVDEQESPPPITDSDLPTSHCGSSVKSQSQKFMKYISKLTVI